MPKKKGGEREKTASALGRKMDAQTLNQKERNNWYNYCTFRDMFKELT